MGMGRGESGGAGEDLPMEKNLKGAAAAAAAGDVGLDKNELFEKMLEVRDQANDRKTE